MKSMQWDLMEVLHFSIISHVEHFFIWLTFEYLFSWSVSLYFCSFLYWIFFFLLLCRHSLYIILISLGSHSKVLQTGWLKQQKSIVSQFWRLAVWDQGVGRVGSCWRLGGKKIYFTIFSQFLVVYWQSSVIPWLVKLWFHLHMVFSQCTCLHIQISPFIRTPVILD